MVLLGANSPILRQEDKVQIVPIKELKDGARISEMCHASDEPIHVTKNGYADMVIMSSSAYDELARMANANRTATAIQEGIEAIQRGECQDAYEALSSIRGKYGI